MLMSFLPTGGAILRGVDLIDTTKKSGKTQFTLIVSAPGEKVAIARAKIWGMIVFPPRNLEIISVKETVSNPVFKQWQVIAEMETSRENDKGPREPEPEEPIEETPAGFGLIQKARSFKNVR